MSSLAMNSLYEEKGNDGYLWSREGGVLPYKSDGGARREISRTPLKGTRILFYGRVPNSFPPLRGTNSITTNYIKVPRQLWRQSFYVLAP